MAIPEAPTSSTPVTPSPIPVYSCVDGLVSCVYAASFMRGAAERRGVPLPGALSDALAFFSATAARDDLALRFMLEPGELMLWHRHNYTQLHSRTGYQDDPAHRRLLLRLWLKSHAPRPADPDFQVRARVYDRVYEELGSAQPWRRGRRAASAQDGEGGIKYCI